MPRHRDEDEPRCPGALGGLDQREVAVAVDGAEPVASLSPRQHPSERRYAADDDRGVPYRLLERLAIAEVSTHDLGATFSSVASA
jgi:hypothetical protein